MTDLSLTNEEFAALRSIDGSMLQRRPSPEMEIRLRSLGLIQRDGNAFAVYYAQCHGHGDEAEAWVDVVVGSWGEPAYADHATLYCFRSLRQIW